MCVRSKWILKGRMGEEEMEGRERGMVVKRGGLIERKIQWKIGYGAVNCRLQAGCCCVGGDILFSK